MFILGKVGAGEPKIALPDSQNGGKDLNSRARYARTKYQQIARI
jgi:hypothetical protein